jgi:hypothetical protein
MVGKKNIWIGMVFLVVLMSVSVIAQGAGQFRNPSSGFDFGQSSSSQYGGVNFGYGSGDSGYGGYDSYRTSRNVQRYEPGFNNPRSSFGGSSNFGGGYSSGFNSGINSGSSLYGYGQYAQYGGQFGFSPDACANRQDFLVNIVPAGCTPGVVRSDLLEEQNAPVFCKLTSFQLNPLLSGTRIRSISVRGQLPEGVSGISHIPSRSALNRGFNRDFVTNPLNDNMGHLVVVLSKQFNESSMPDYVEGNVSAVIDYDSLGGFGVGENTLYLAEMTEEEWQRDYRNNGIWNGRAYLRVESILPDRVSVSVYRDANSRENTVTIPRGGTSERIYLGGSFCTAGMTLSAREIGAPTDSALIQINDEQRQVSVGDRIINGRCRITKIEAMGAGGTLDLSCPRSGRFQLRLLPGNAKLNVGNVENEYRINQLIKDNFYLGYSGIDNNGDKFVVIVEDKISTSELEFSDKEVFNAVDGLRDKSDIQAIKDIVLDRYTKRVFGLKNKRNIEDNMRVFVLNEKSPPEKDIRLVEVDTPQNIRPKIDPSKEGYYQDSLRYYGESTKSYRDLADFYPQESFAVGQEPLAVDGLRDAIELSSDFKQQQDTEEFLRTFSENYPDRYLGSDFDRNRDRLYKYDNTQARRVVEVDGLTYSINLLELKSPSRADSSVVFLIDGKETTLGLNDFANVGDVTNKVNFQLIQMQDNGVVIEYDYNDNDGKKQFGRETLDLVRRQQTNLNGVNIKLINVNFKPHVKISINPNIGNTRTNANFKFKIGIEKRAIQLSPEKTKEIMESILKAIEEWEEINKKLGKVIKALKGACFATSTLLTVKNLFDGGSGRSMARGRIMTSSGGWNDKCDELVDRKEFTSVSQCLLKHSSEIEKDVKIYSQEIERTNRELKEIQSRTEIKRTDILDFQGQADSATIEREFKSNFDEFCKTAQGDVTLPTAGRGTLSFQNDLCKLDSMTHEQRRELMTLHRIRQAGGSDTLKNVVNRDLGRVALDAKNFDDERIGRQLSIQNTERYNLDLKTTYPVNDRITNAFVKTVGAGDISHKVYGQFDKGTNVVRIQIPNRELIQGEHAYTPTDAIKGKEFIVPLKSFAGSSNIYSADSKQRIFTIDGIEIKGDDKTQLLAYMDLSGMKRIRRANSQSFSNQMVNVEQLRVKYFEREPYRGLPSLVPFDVDEGWYVKTNYVLSGFGKPYDESGRVVNFYICNVGPNGDIEFKQSGDDVCRYYNGHSQDITFPGMSIAESSLLIQKAKRSIDEAARQYGKERVNVNGVGFNSGISSDGSDGRCTDFMSPEDCSIMFNVCDPVICPASRCDLGGRYRVDNVIQSGIIGSIALCLPNINEGIAVPICLTGVHAGLDGYISILNSTAACLNESLETGRNIGICDEIKSIYLCEFFWRQATPFLNVLLERGFELLMGQGVRGGGEYLTAKTAWTNTQKSVEYFKSQYAVNSIRAFQSRNTEFIGENLETSFCRNFISGGFSGAATDVFDALLEPDSPEQYHGWFSEHPMTTATVPPQSHYKVYFHIFAGKDIGAFYSVYLKDITLEPGIGSTGVWMVDRGYAGRGSQVDRAKDFVAPSGFKQLCININGQEECGFGKVSTSYALNALSDAYAKEQVEQEIISEKQCVAGSPSLYSLAQPNLQDGFQEAIEPQLYNKGIVRVCSTENPGKQVTSEGEFDRTKSRYDQWKEVGYCDDPALKCWLDTSSVKDVVRDLGVEQEALDNVNVRHFNADGLQLPEEGLAIISRARNVINNLYVREGDNYNDVNQRISSTIFELERVTNVGSNNVIRANALLVLGKLHKKIAQGFLGLSLSTSQPTPNEAYDPIPSQEDPTDPFNNDNDIDTSLELDTLVDSDLEMNLLIKLNNPEKESNSYKFSDTGGWTTNDEAFDSKVSYIQGIRNIVNKIELNGLLVIAGKEYNYIDYNYANKDDLLDTIIINSFKEQ